MHVLIRYSQLHRFGLSNCSPLQDHKPNREDETRRIEAAGGCDAAHPGAPTPLGPLPLKKGELVDDLIMV